VHTPIAILLITQKIIYLLAYEKILEIIFKSHFLGKFCAQKDLFLRLIELENIETIISNDFGSGKQFNSI